MNYVEGEVGHMTTKENGRVGWMTYVSKDLYRVTSEVLVTNRFILLERNFRLASKARAILFVMYGEVLKT